MNKKQQIKLIDQIFTKLGVLNDKTHTPYLGKLYEMNKQEEREHRRFVGSEYHLPVNDAARYYSVKYIWQGYKLKDQKDKGWTVKDVLTVRQAAIYGQSIAENYRQVIFVALKQFIESGQMDEFDQIDYVQLISKEGA